MFGIPNSPKIVPFFPPDSASPAGGVLAAAPDPDALPAAGILGPMSSAQKWSLALSGVQDATQALQGRRGGNYEDQQAQIEAERQQAAQASQFQRQQQIHAKIKTLAAAGDWDGVRQTLIDADPADVAHISAVLSAGQSKIQDIGGAGYSVPQWGGLPQKVIAAPVKAPATRTIQDGNNNVSQHFDNATGLWVTDGQGPKWAPHVVKPDPNAAPKMPWQMFGGK